MNKINERLKNALSCKPESMMFTVLSPCKEKNYSSTSVSILGLRFKCYFVFNCFRSKENSLQAATHPAFTTLFLRNKLRPTISINRIVNIPIASIL